MRNRRTKPSNGTDPNAEVALHHIGKIVSRLRFHDRDIILIRRGSALAKEDVLDNIRKAISQIIKKNALLMVVDDFNDITTIDEGEMNKAGWYKIETVYKLLKRGYTMVPKGTSESAVIEDLVGNKEKDDIDDEVASQ